MRAVMRATSQSPASKAMRAVALGSELDVAGGNSIEGMIGAHAHVVARVPLGSALAHEDVARHHHLAPELFHAEPLRLRIAAVARRAACLFVCHGSNPSATSSDAAQAPMISLMRTKLRSWRWPFLRREFWRRRFL